MPQAVSTKFSNAQAAPTNIPVAKVQLVLGNYCSSAAYGASATSTGNFSADYPAEGAIDGDRTEINVGPALGADNNVGQSSWRSAATLNNMTPQILTIAFNATRTINRIKFYHLSGHGISSYSLDYWNGSAWIEFASTTPEPSPEVLIITTGTLDVVDTLDITTTQIRARCYNGFVPSDYANIVELEAYRKVDITSRVKGVKVSRQRDYKLANPLAASVTLDCINTDRFFSINHVPTITETTQGFVNPELQPNAQILVTFGFNTYGSAAELVPSIVAYLDSISPKPSTRDCKIVGRDGLKNLINRTDSSNLKTNIELSKAIQYVLNRGNVSTYETSLGVTNIVIPYFFTDQEDQLTTIRNLTQAAGDSLFYYNESGIAIFQFYTGNLPLSYVYPVQAPWASGTLAGSTTVNGSNQLTLTGAGGGSGETVAGTGFSTGVLNIPASPNRVTGLAQRIIPGASGTINQVNFPIIIHWAGTQGFITVRVSLYSDSGGLPSAELFQTTVSNNLGPSTSPFWELGAINVPFAVTGGTPYWIVFQEDSSNPANCVFFMQNINIGATAWSGGSQTYARFTPHGSGPCTGNPTSQTAWQPVEDSNSAGPIGVSAGSYIFSGSHVSGTWISAPLDTGVGTTAFRTISPTQSVNGGTISYSTRTSPDGITWSPYVAIDPVTNQILSPTNRYIQTQIALDVNSSTVAPIILDVEVNWTGGTGVPKYTPAPASFTFNYNSNLIDMEQSLADNLGGDTSIINDIAVQASPLLLTGLSTDTAWQGVIGTPPVNISPTAPLTVHAGDVLTFTPYISGGMDTSGMSLSSPAPALAVVSSPSSGVVGGYAFTQVSPTLPVFIIRIVGNGVLTDVRVIGQTFSGSTSIQAVGAISPSSISKYGDRKQSIQNTWIVTSQVAQVIANTLLANYANPFSYIPSFDLQPTFSMQIGDRVTVKDINLDLNQDYIIVGMDHEFIMSMESASVKTSGKLLVVPPGD